MATQHYSSPCRRPGAIPYAIKHSHGCVDSGLRRNDERLNKSAPCRALAGRRAKRRASLPLRPKLCHPLPQGLRYAIASSPNRLRSLKSLISLVELRRGTRLASSPERMSCLSHKWTNLFATLHFGVESADYFRYLWARFALNIQT